ncbi:MAG: SDR family NAD(P)-dependent oxidoreductase, partial [Acidimicrobiales bacterium]
ARILIPRMTARGGGYLLNTASAAGLLTNLGDAPYTVTKSAAVALAEWLSITHGDDGIKVSCLAPMAVRTPMTDSDDPAVANVVSHGMIEPETVADAVVAGIASEQLLILPHPEVAQFMATKASAHEKWLGGMRRLQKQFFG